MSYNAVYLDLAKVNDLVVLRGKEDIVPCYLVMCNGFVGIY